MIRVKAAVFSITPPLPPDDDGSYLRWHLLDHMPEQYQLPGIQHAIRYIADGEYPEHRVVTAEPLDDVGSVVNYLVGDPVQQTHDDFMTLAARLTEMGRYPEARPLLQLRMPALDRWYAAPRALVSPEVVPFRPHRGIVLIVEQPVTNDLNQWRQWLHTDHHPALLSERGVAGVWTYADPRTWKLHRALRGEPQHTTVVYVDEDPLLVVDTIRPLIEQRWDSGAVRPLFAGPLRTMMQWDVWPGEQA